MIQLAWRMVKFQPHYVAFKRWGPVLNNPKSGGGARKKAIVALARRLAVDLWRIATGRRKPEELGLRLKVCA